MKTESDVVIIGAGMSGAAAAYALSAECRVALIEAEPQPGYHATGRSAALYERHYGNATVRLFNAASFAFLTNPPEGFADGPLIKERGGLTIATADRRDALEALLDEAADRRVLDQAEALRLVPVLRADAVDAAVYETGVMDMDVHAIHHGFLRQAARRGAQLTLDRPVRRIARDGSAWRIESDGAVWQAPIIVNAAGAWADVVAGSAGLEPVGLVAKRRTVVILPAPPIAGHDGWPAVGVAGTDQYFKPESGRIMASPGDATALAPQDVQPDELDVALVMDWLDRTTTLPLSRIERRWAGLRTFAPDNSPVAGEDPRAAGFFWLAGQGGYGIMMAESLGRLLAGLIMKRGVPADLDRLGLDLRAVLPRRFRS